MDRESLWRPGRFRFSGDVRRSANAPARAKAARNRRGLAQVGEWPVGEFIRERNKQIADEARKRGAGDFEYVERYKLFRLEEF